MGVSPWSWWFMAALIAVGFAVGIASRLGRRRWFVAKYRSRSYPAAYRNLELVVPLVAVAMTSLMLIIAPESLGLDIQLPVSHGVAGLLLFAAVAVFFGAIGAACVLGARPPRWFIPAWLREEDHRIGFVRPPLDWFDWALFGLGLVLLLISIGAIVGSFYELLTG